MTAARIYIAIPVHNRIDVAKLCIPTVHAGMSTGDRLALYNDGSHCGTLPMSLLKIANEYVHDPIKIGIEAQRRMHFRVFCALKDYTHLYLTDADALHDPTWRRKLLWLQANAGELPVCGYNTEAHARLSGNTLEDKPESPVIWRAVAPGISYLLTRHDAEIVTSNMPDQWNWDWTVPALLGSRMAIARESVVDHIGYGGMHHPAGEGLEGGDRALNPTPWLVAKRAEIVQKLNADSIQA